MDSRESGLIRIRKAKGLRREQVAAEAGISARYLWGLETGRHRPSLAVARRLASALRVSIDQLFPEAA